MHSDMIYHIQEKLKNQLDKARYEHTLGVMHTAGSLAMAYEYPKEKAMLAGLLHDCAKCLSHEERVTLCQQNHVEITESEHKNKSLLHAKAGAILAKIFCKKTKKITVEAASVSLLHKSRRPHSPCEPCRM